MVKVPIIGTNDVFNSQGSRYIHFIFSLVYVTTGQYVYVIMNHDCVQYTVLTYFNYMVQIGATNTKSYACIISLLVISSIQKLLDVTFMTYTCNNDPS